MWDFVTRGDKEEIKLTPPARRTVLTPGAAAAWPCPTSGQGAATETPGLPSPRERPRGGVLLHGGPRRDTPAHRRVEGGGRRRRRDDDGGGARPGRPPVGAAAAAAAAGGGDAGRAGAAPGAGRLPHAPAAARSRVGPRRDGCCLPRGAAGVAAASLPETRHHVTAPRYPVYASDKLKCVLRVFEPPATADARL